MTTLDYIREERFMSVFLAFVILLIFLNFVFVFWDDGPLGWGGVLLRIFWVVLCYLLICLDGLQSDIIKQQYQTTARVEQMEREQ